MKCIEEFLPPFEICITKEERFMREALKEACKAYSEDETPVGAVVVYEDQVIARAHNQVEQLSDATAHAEMLALTAAENALGNWRLLECALYSTLEPCIMCAGASILCRVPVVVWGAKDLRHGANGSFVDLFQKDKPHPIHTVTIHGGVLGPWSEKLLKSFFKKQRAR